MSIETALQRLLLIVIHRESGYRNHRHVSIAGQCSQCFGQVVTVHHRHPDVGDNHIKMPGLCGGDGGECRIGSDNLIACMSEKNRKHLGYIADVVYDQDDRFAFTLTSTTM